MKTRIRYTVAAVASLCLVSAMSRADILLEDFEGSINGTPTDIVSYSTTTGVTEGTMSAVVQAANSWHDIVFDINVSGATIRDAATKTLAIDITAPASSFSGGWGSGLHLVLQGDGLSWTNLPSQNVSGADKQTFSFDYSGVDLSGVPANPSWFQVVLVTGFGGPDGYAPGPIYVDNLRLVPEPATLGIVGFAGVGMLFFRRLFAI